MLHLSQEASIVATEKFQLAQGNLEPWQRTTIDDIYIQPQVAVGSWGGNRVGDGLVPACNGVIVDHADQVRPAPTILTI